MRDREPGNATLFINGRVLTQEASRPVADWLWVTDGAVQALGKGVPQPPSGIHNRTYDLRGRVLAPAFSDAHVHLASLATALLGPDLSLCDSREAVLAELASWRDGAAAAGGAAGDDGAPAAGRGPGGDWIVGHGMDESAWPERRLPARADIDRVEKERPVLLQRVCGHVGVVNTAALRTLTLGPHTDAGSGRVAEDDLFALNDRLRPDAAALAAVLPRIVTGLHAHGLTAVHDVTSPEMLRALRETGAAGRLDLRVSCSLPVKQPDAFATAVAARDCDDSRLRVLGLKLFVDGSLGARTAFLRQPYADAPATRGAPLYVGAGLAALGRRAHDAGLQLMVHAIGDAALDLALDALAPFLAAGNPLRHRLEHVEVTPPDLVERLARSGAWACVQPNFAGRWSHPGGLNEQRLGGRLGHCNAYRSLLAAGVRLAFGSDCMPLGPAFGLRSAIRHPIEAERLEAAAALALYTAAAAEITHAENLHGRITPGLAADLVVLSSDPGQVGAPDEPLVDATFLDGRQVYARQGAE